MLPLPPWMADLTKLCNKFNVEPELIEQTEVKKLKFNCPQQLSGEEQAALIRSLPHDIVSEFVVFPKKITISSFTMILGMLGIRLDSIDYTEDRELDLKAHAENVPIKILSNFPGLNGKEFKITTYLNNQSTVFGDLSYLMKLDGAIDKWSFVCDGLSISKDVKGLPAAPPEDIGLDPRKYLGEALEKMLTEIAEKYRNENPAAFGNAEPESPSFDGEQEIDGIPHTEQPYDRLERISPLFDMSKNRKASKASSTPKGHDGVVRDSCPSEDDITNLKIALGQAQSIDDVLKAIEGGK